MPQLNSEAGVPTVELVGLETSRDKLLEIYLEVYKLHRLPGSPPGELAIVQEVLAAIPDHHQRGGGVPEAQAQPSPGHPHPSNRRRPHWEWESSVDRSLAKNVRSSPTGTLCHGGLGGRNWKARPNEGMFTVDSEIKEPGSLEV